MGTSTCRITDIGVGVCACHPPAPPIPTIGMLITGAATVTDDMFMTSRVTDVIIHMCGHPSLMITGSMTVEKEAFASSRIADLYVGCVIGLTITGSPLVSDE